MLILTQDNQKIFLTKKNINKYFNFVYILIKKNNNNNISSNIYKKIITDEIIDIIKDNFILWKTSINIIQNDIFFNKIILMSKNKAQLFNIFNFILDETNIVIPFFNITFSSLLPYLENIEGNNLEKIYNNMIISQFLNNNNILNENNNELFKNIKESYYWTISNNCLKSLTKQFTKRNFNKIIKYNNIINNYLIIYDSNFTKEDINKIFSNLNDTQKYYLFSNLIISKKYYYLVINNEYILNLMKPIINKYIPVFRYLFSYTWLYLYYEEKIINNKLKTNDNIVFDINTASLLPIFPFLYEDIKINPYMSFMVNNEILNPLTNFNGLKEYTYTDNNKNYFNKGICNLTQFRERLNIFIMNKSNLNIFENINWNKLKMAICGPIMTACLQVQHPLVNMFDETDFDNKLLRFYNEYYALTNIHIIFLANDIFEYMNNVNEFYNQIVVNMCAYSSYVETEHIYLTPNFEALFYVNDEYIKNIIVNENITFDYIKENINKEFIIKLFKPYLKTILDNKYNKEFKDISIEELEKIKLNYPDYFVNYDLYNLKININNLNTNDILINYKYKLHSPHFNHSFELYKIKEKDFMNFVSKTPLPCFRAYYNGTNVYMTPSCITAHLTYMNIDYNPRFNIEDTCEIININRMRGFGTWLNDGEIIYIVNYIKNNIFWSKLYGITNKNIKLNLGSLNMSNRLFNPRLYNESKYFNINPVDLTSGYNNKYIGDNMNINTITNNELTKRFGFSRIIDFPMNNFKAINNDGDIIPLDKWIIEAYFEFINKIY